MPPGARIQLIDVGRRFKPTNAPADSVLNHFDLIIEPGEFVVLLGPSGCGKSTLLRLLAGLDRPDAGAIDVSLEGENCGFVFQEPALLPWKNVLHNAALPLILAGDLEALAKARETLNWVGLADACEKFPHQLSGGMKMRVSIARAIIGKPRLLLLDEPFSALDELTRFRLQEELRQLWSRMKMTVVFVTHSIGEAVFLSDRTIVLSPRPAKILLDRRSQLPTERGEALRDSPELLAELKRVSQAVRGGGVA